MKLLSVIVPSYNSSEYLARCIESLLIGDNRLEVIIVNDGSTDNTGEIAEEYSHRYPEIIHVIHQENKGHGGGINTGLAHAQGKYFKVIDSDDWADKEGLIKIMSIIDELITSNQKVDLLVNNYVYERDGKTLNKTVPFRDVFPSERIFTWDEVKSFPRGKYLMMHALIYNTELLYQSYFKLPEHTFYVDNLYVYLPLRRVESLMYVDVDLYHYYIGRDDQSITEKNMIKRIDQQLKVNKSMIKATDWDAVNSPASESYLIKHLEVVMGISSSLLNKIGTRESMQEKIKLWKELEKNDYVYQKINRTIIARIIKSTKKPNVWTSNRVYRIVRAIAGY